MLSKESAAPARRLRARNSARTFEPFLSGSALLSPPRGRPGRRFLAKRLDNGKLIKCR